MKHYINYIIAILLLAMIANCIVMGVGIYKMDTSILTVAAYIEAVLILLLLPCLLYKSFSRARCPHCRKINFSEGKFCPHCGKEIVK